jgi:predicted metalloprotease
MRLGRQSGNIEDRRGMSPGIAVGGGLGTIVLVLVALFFGVDPSVVLQGGAPSEPPPVSQSQTPSASPGADPMKEFVSAVLADTEDTWRTLFRDMNREYKEPKLVLFSGAINSACGMAQSASGPFYCPPDQKVYLDMSFFRDLQNRFKAPGDFAQAYVIAHEVGHHVQTLLGISQKVRGLQERAGERERNALSVRQELQADCFAGVWAFHANRARQVLEAGDVEEGLNAAAAIGDDRLQRQSRGTVVPDAFTHGSSAQRVRWFKQGLEAGDVGKCDTLNARAL